jgi:hypothetical protein
MMDEQTTATLDNLMARMNDSFERVMEEIVETRKALNERLDQVKLELERQIRTYGR